MRQDTQRWEGPRFSERTQRVRCPELLLESKRMATGGGAPKNAAVCVTGKKTMSPSIALHARRSPVRREERFPGCDIAGCRAAGCPFLPLRGPAGCGSRCRRSRGRLSVRPPGGAATLAAQGGRTCRVRGRGRAGSAVPLRSEQRRAPSPPACGAPPQRSARIPRRGTGRAGMET